MAESLDFYVNVLSGSSSGLAAVSALQSLDSAAAKATSGIQALEGQVASAKAKLETLNSGDAVKGLALELSEAKAKLDAIRSGKVPFNAGEYKRASDAVGKLGGQLDAAKSKQAAAVSAQQSKIEALTGKLKEQKDAQASTAALTAAKRAQMVKGLDEQVSKLGQLASAAQEAGIPGAGLLTKLQGLAKAGPAAAIAAVVAALIALTAAGIAAAVALTKYALAAADAARSSALLSSAAAGSGSAGWELEKVVSQLAATIPIARDKLAEWARELALAGIAGRDMQRTLTTMGIVASAVGDQAAGKIKSIAEASRMAQKLMLGARDRFGEFAALQGTGIKAADIYAAVAKSMRVSIPEAARLVNAGIVPIKKGLEALEIAAETRFGPIVAKQALSLTAQMSKLKENLAGLFSGVNIETFLQGLKTITDLFAENSVLGYTLRQVFGTFFSDLSDKSKGVFPLIKAGIYGVAFAVIMLLTWGKKLANTISDTFGGKLDGIDKAKVAFMLGAAAVGGFVGVLLGIPLILAAIATSIAIITLPLWLPFALGAAMIYLMVKALTYLKDQIAAAFGALDKIDLGKAAENIMNSLINGIKAKIADVKDAITSVGSAITGAFDTEMEIKSPSKKMTRRANWVVDPLVTVPEQRTGEVHAAIGRLGELPPPAEQDAGRGSQSAGPSFTFKDCTFGSNMADVKQAMNEWWVEKMLGESRGFAMVPT